LGSRVLGWVNWVDFSCVFNAFWGANRKTFIISDAIEESECAFQPVVDGFFETEEEGDEVEVGAIGAVAVGLSPFAAGVWHFRMPVNRSSSAERSARSSAAARMSWNWAADAGWYSAVRQVILASTSSGSMSTLTAIESGSRAQRPWRRRVPEQWALPSGVAAPRDFAPLARAAAARAGVDGRLLSIRDYIVHWGKSVGRVRGCRIGLESRTYARKILLDQA
jgi:hypothetical protein